MQSKLYTTALIFFFLVGSNALAILKPAELNAIGAKVWRNECAGTVAGLMSWNQGENFLSLGIGHNIWYSKNHRENFDESFPKLIKFMRQSGVTIPKWLDQNEIPPCPWQTKAEFLQAKQAGSATWLELQRFLVKTIPWQTKYLLEHLQTTLPQILELIPDTERPQINHILRELQQTPTGCYALIDYLNFKGDGIKEYRNGANNCSCDCKQVYACGWGLLQVLRKMLHAPKNLTAEQAYVWAVKTTLTCRVLSAPKARKANEERWLPGWLKRADTYNGI